VRRALTAVPLAIAVGLGALAVSRVWTTSGEPLDVALERCAASQDLGTLERCVAVTLVDGLGRRSAEEAADALERALVDEPLLLEACHVPSHEAGARLFRSRSGLEAFLRHPSVMVCQSGLLHGMLAAYAATTPPTGDVISLLERCAEMRETPGMLEACGDSVGHVVWESVGTFRPAVEACFTAGGDRVAENCVKGVFMQFYNPVAPSEQGGMWAPPVGHGEVVALCSDLSTVPMRAACAEAAHYAWSDELTGVRADLWDLPADRRAGALGGVLLPTFGEALAFCAAFEGAGATRCAEQLLGFVLNALPPMPAEAVGAVVCEAVGAAQEPLCTRLVRERFS